MPGVRDQFPTMPLLRQFFVLDIERGTMLRHEVRRDPATGMTLTASFLLAHPLALPADLPSTPIHQGVLQHGKAGSST